MYVNLFIIRHIQKYIIDNNNNNGFSTKNIISNGHMFRYCFHILIIIVIFICVHKYYINFGLRFFDAASFANSATPLGASTHSLNTTHL